MRLSWLILVGISTLGCKDRAAPHPQATGSAGSAAAPSAKVATPALPAEGSDVGGHDQAWADAMAKTIQTVAPDLTNVTCKGVQCDATLSAANEEELVKRAEALQSEQSLKQLDDARGVMLTAPTKKDGKVSMTIHVLFDQ